MSEWDHEEARLKAAYDRRRGLDARRYSWSSEAYVFEAQARERVILRRLKATGMLPLEGKRILDVGCGTGRWMRDLIRWGADPSLMAGLEVRPDAVDTARRQTGPHVAIEPGNATDLPFDSDSIDMVVQGTVLSSVLDDGVRERIASEAMRVLRPGGALLWYDFCFNNPGNPDVRAVTMGELRALFPGCRFELERATLAPPLMRWVAPLSWLGTCLLGAMPWLCAFYAGLIIKPEPALPETESDAFVGPFTEIRLWA